MKIAVNVFNATTICIIINEEGNLNELQKREGLSSG